MLFYYPSTKEDKYIILIKHTTTRGGEGGHRGLLTFISLFNHCMYTS